MVAEKSNLGKVVIKGFFALIGGIGAIVTIIAIYPVIKPQSGYLPKRIDLMENNNFSIKIQNRGQWGKKYRLELDSSFLSFKSNNNEHDDAVSILMPNRLTWYPIDLAGGGVNVHNVEINGLYNPKDYNPMNSNAYIELKILTDDGKEEFSSRCYYSLEVTNGIGQPSYADFENSLLDTTGNSEKHRAECKIF